MTGVCWMLMILVGCRLSHATPPQSECACNDRVEHICVPAGHSVIIPCPVLQGEEVNFNLLKDGNVIYNHTCDSKEMLPNCTSKSTSLDVELCENVDNKSVSFKLTRVNISSSAVYRCGLTVMYPPPLKRVPGKVAYLVLIEGYQCHRRDTKTKEEPNCGLHWIWIVAVVSVYSLTITVVAVLLWFKLRKTDSQSDYMNTKPRAHRDRRRKGEVKHPIPRHF